jgi:phage baseplate assembly protein W
MSDIVRETIASLTAGLVTLSSTAQPPFGYGIDLVCVSDIDAHMAETMSDTVQSLAQDSFHRITTPRGSMPDDPNYGIDIRSMLSAGLTQSAIRGISSAIHGELTKDDRIADVEVDLSIGGTCHRAQLHNQDHHHPRRWLVSL